ncbi:MAG: hypothetical protein HQL77_05745 [Magnetococcales bacterium]|nr:hypothetical protein [Magnetococcales bacterium]
MGDLEEPTLWLEMMATGLQLIIMEQKSPGKRFPSEYGIENHLLQQKFACGFGNYPKVGMSLYFNGQRC